MYLKPFHKTMDQINPSQFAALEALLFYYGSPMARTRVASILGLPKEHTDLLIEAYRTTLESDPSRGCLLTVLGDEVQLLTKPVVREVVERAMKEELREELTPAGLETLALIAYLAPVARPTLDYVRGVNSSFIVRNLLVRGLIERDGAKGNAYLYRPTGAFLSHLGLSSLEQLPDFERFRTVLREFEETANRTATEEVPPNGTVAA